MRTADKLWFYNIYDNRNNKTSMYKDKTCSPLTKSFNINPNYYPNRLISDSNHFTNPPSKSLSSTKIKMNGWPFQNDWNCPMIIVTPWQVHRSRCNNYLTCWWSTRFNNIHNGLVSLGFEPLFPKVCLQRLERWTSCWYICDEKYKCANPVVSFRWPTLTLDMPFDTSSKVLYPIHHKVH